MTVSYRIRGLVRISFGPAHSYTAASITNRGKHQNPDDDDDDDDDDAKKS